MSETGRAPHVDPTVATDMRALLADETHHVQLETEAVVADRYRVESLLGTGGMAHVLRATDLVLDREVAVKLLRETPDSETDVRRFLAETRTLARLSHPGLVTVLDGGTTASGRPYLVMELVDGPALSASLDEAMHPDRVAEVGTQVAAALAYAHAQGVVHRDVKPGNVLVRADGRVKLADFGIAKLVGEQSLHTRTGTVLGSVHYLAPEQVAFEEITPAVDVYALGLLLLRCLTGHHAFDGPTIESALARLSASPEVPSDLSPGWRELLTAMTARSPEDRPSAADVAGRLAWLAGAQAPPRVAAPGPPVPAPVPLAPRARRHRFSPVAVAVVALTAVMLVAAAMTGDGAASEQATAAGSAASTETVARGAAADAGADEEAGGIVPVAVVDPVQVAKPAKADTRGKAEATKAEKAKKDKTKKNKKKGRDKPAKDKHPGKGKGHGKPGKGR